MSRAAVGPQKNFKPPCKVIVLGIEGQDPAAVEALNKRLAGTISRFYNAARQNSDNSVGDVWHQRKALPDRQGLLSYSSNQGMETLTIRLNPRFVEELVEDPKPEKPKRPWDWVVFEAVVRDMGPGNDESDSRPYGLAATSSRTKPPVNTDIEWETIYNYTMPSDESDTVFPVMRYAYSPLEYDPRPPMPGIVLASLLVDLRSLGTQTLEAKLTADLVGGRARLPGNYSKVNVGATVASSSTSLIGRLSFDYVNGEPTPTAVYTGADDLWPVNQGPHYYNVSAAHIAPLASRNAVMEQQLAFFPVDNDDNTLPAGNIWLTRNFRFEAGAAPIPALLDGAAYFSGFGASNAPVIHAMLQKRYCEPLEYWPDGTIKKYLIARPRIGNRYANTLAGRREWHVEYEIWRDERVVNIDPATLGIGGLQQVPTTRNVEFWFLGGWGVPTFGEQFFEDADTRRHYTQWVVTNEPLVFFQTAKLDYEATITNTADDPTPVGTLQIDRMAQSLKVLPP